MRILLVSNYQPPHMGGIEFAAQSLKRCWEKDGHAVTWLTTDLPPGARPSTPDNVRLPAWNQLEERLQINSPFVPPWHHGAIHRAVAAADVVNVHSLAPGLSNTALRAAWRARKPVVVTQHVAVIPLKLPLLSAYQRHHVTRLARATVRRGGHLTFVGQAVREWFEREAALPADRITMTPAGIDQDTYQFVDTAERARLRQKWQTADGFHVLFVGRFYDKKGLPLIRDIAAARPDIRFTLVGGGPLQPQAWGLPNVRIHSFVSNEDLRELYGCHDLFIMPSFGEGWPAVVPQAMICGLSCLVSEECFAGFNRDADRFIVCPRTADAVAAALQAAAARRSEAEARRAQVSAYAAATWDWQRTARIYADLFSRLPAAAN